MAGTAATADPLPTSGASSASVAAPPAPATPWIVPLLVLAATTVRAQVRTFRVPALGVVALLPVLFLGAVLSLHPGGAAYVALYQAFLRVFQPLVVLLVVLVLAVPLLRDELDEQSISYLMTRTIGKPRIILGKYLGVLGSASLALFPTSLLGYGLVAANAGTAASSLHGVLASLLVVEALGILAYAALFLLLGLLTRRAFLIGLVYSFLWEFLLGELPGLAPDLSLLHYLLTIPTYWTSGGALASYPTSLGLSTAFAVPLAVALAAIVLAIVAYSVLDAAPAPE